MVTALMSEPGRLYYTLFMLLAFATFFAVRRCQPAWLAPRNLDFRQKLILGMSAFSGGAFGARIGAIVEQVSRQPMPFDWLILFSDGKTIIAGLFGAYLAIELAKLLIGVRAKTGDAYALPIAAAMCVGRWGCFLNGCCYGKQTDLPWAVDFSPLASGMRHPTQIYESIFHFCCALVLWQLIKRKSLRHQLLKLYLITYCAFRFMTEFIRPAEIFLLGMTFYQVMAMLFGTLLAIQWWVDDRKMRSRMQNEQAADA